MDTKKFYMTDAQYLNQLQRMRERIAHGEMLVIVNSEEIGEQFTHCSWGLCTGDIDFWQSDELLHPENPPKNTGHFEAQAGDFSFDVEMWFVTPKHRQHNHFCPFDRGADGSASSAWGCFDRCKIFHPRKDEDPVLPRENAVRMFDVHVNSLLRKKQQEEETVYAAAV
jgi:hypothetical protein